jgi:hypothetical protein
MIQMRSDGEKLVPVPPRSRSRVIVSLITALAILLVAWAMRPDGSDRGAVVRVALSSVPEERVVHFGHEFPRPGPAGPDAVLAAGEPAVSGEAASPTDRTAPPPASAAQIAKQAAREQRPANYAKPDANGVLPIGFSLAEGVSAVSGGVGVSKTIAAEGGEATGLTIFLIGGSLIEVDRGELVTALARLGASEKAGNLPAAGESGRLSLDRVRTAGLDLRYDAIRDRLVLRP